MPTAVHAPGPPRRPPSGPPVVRARALQGLPALLTRHDADPRAWFHRFGLPLAGVSAESYVPLARVNALMDAAAAELGHPSLALELASAEDASILGPLAVAMEACATAAQAIDCAVQYLFVHSSAMRVALEPAGAGVVALTYDIVVPGAPYPVQGMELGLALMHRLALLLSGRKDHLVGVQVRHPAPSDTRAAEEFFGLRPAYDQGRCALLLRDDVLQTPVRSGNEAVRRLALEHLSRFEDSTSVGAQVRSALVDALGITPVSVTWAGRLLNVHPRTLQRQLGQEGSGFAEILDEVRRDRAQRLLTTTALPLTQCAALLGLAEQATLTRACRRWFGRTPTEVRRAAQG